MAVPLVDFTHDLEAMAAAVTPRTKMVIVCNPNNPTGTYVPVAEIARLVEAVPERRADRHRRGLQRVRDGGRPRGCAGAAGGARERRRPAHLLQDLRPVRPARRLRPRAPPSSRWRSTRCASPSTSTGWRRSPPSRRSSIRTRWRGGASTTRRCARHWWRSSPSAAARPCRRETNFMLVDMRELCHPQEKVCGAALHGRDRARRQRSGLSRMGARERGHGERDRVLPEQDG